MHILGRNMAYIMKSLKNGKIYEPEYSEKIKTNFIR